MEKDAYTLNAPFSSSDNVTITPEFGLLTNPDAIFTTNTAASVTVTFRPSWVARRSRPARSQPYCNPSRPSPTSC